MHAFLGCDTTSRIYGFGKSAMMKKIKSDKSLMQAAEVFLSLHSSSAEIQKAGEQAMTILYNGNPDESLNGFRYKHYNEKVATNIVHVQPQVLPPTEAATKFHSFRVYYQICQWLGCSNEMQPEAWGWKMSESGLTPIQTDLLPAPEDLLKVIRCGCTSDYGSLRCSCKKNGLKCTLACSNCKGLACQNASVTSVSDDEGDSEL